MKSLFLSVLVVALFTACSSEKEEPSASAEVKIDLDETKESMKKAFSEAETEIKKGAEATKEKLSEAGDALKEKVEEAQEKLSADEKAEVKVEVKKD